MNFNEDIRDLATILAEVIRRMGASYGSREDWRIDLAKCVSIMEHNQNYPAMLEENAILLKRVQELEEMQTRQA